jgi:hypothetical protein
MYIAEIPICTFNLKQYPIRMAYVTRMAVNEESSSFEANNMENAKTSTRTSIVASL